MHDDHVIATLEELIDERAAHEQRSTDYECARHHGSCRMVAGKLLSEVTASGAAQWRLRADLDAARRERVERATLRIIGWSFLALAAYVVFDSASALLRHEPPERSVVGLVLLALSAIVMPVLARAKRRVARAMTSRALEADAMQTSLCAYLSVIALAGVALNAGLDWWWADPVAALAMVPIIAKEGVEGVRGEAHCADECR
jgi:hypothetical protein